MLKTFPPMKKKKAKTVAARAKSVTNVATTPQAAVKEALGS